MRKRSHRFARFVTVFLALLVALVLTGMGYGAWSDTISVLGTVNTGTRSAVLSVEGCLPAGDVTCTLSDYYTAQPPNPDRIEVTIWNPEANGDYYCAFLITNNGTIPMKVENIEIGYGNLPVGSTVDLSMEEGQQAEGGFAMSGTVHTQLPGTVDPDADYTFTVTFVVVQWNQ